MKVTFPQPPSGPFYQFYTQVFDTIRKAFVGVVSQNEASARVLLQSPDGTVWAVTVDDTGALVTEVNDGKDRI